MVSHDEWTKKMEAAGAAEAKRNEWGRQMMRQIAGLPPEPGDEWTQEMIDASLKEEAQIEAAITIFDAAFEEALTSVVTRSGTQVVPGTLSDLHRDRVLLQEMKAGMMRARGYRVVAKETHDEAAPPSDD